MEIIVNETYAIIIASLDNIFMSISNDISAKKKEINRNYFWKNQFDKQKY